MFNINHYESTGILAMIGNAALTKALHVSFWFISLHDFLFTSLLGPSSLLLVLTDFIIF